MSAEVFAAGGVVWRRGDGEVEIALVHRPKYDDWTLPKGKLDEGESFEDAALREVEEETGLRCELGRFLDEVTYRDHKDREKLVRYWEMSGGEGDFQPNEEVDELRWVPVGEAESALSYKFDRRLVARLASGGAP